MEQCYPFNWKLEGSALLLMESKVKKEREKDWKKGEKEKKLV